MAIKIEMLRCFSTVAQTGSLAEAARHLGRTPSAVSMTLKQLEEHLGQRLFETDRKNRLTALGGQVLELAQGQLRQFDETVAAIEATAEAPKGLIRIVSVPSVAALVIPGALQEMRRRHPGLKLELRDTDTQHVAEALVQGRADVGIASVDFSLNGVRSFPLFEDRFGLVCSTDHPLATQQGRPTIPQVAASGFIRNALCDLIETPAFQQTVAGADITVHNTLSLIAMVRQGHWVTVLPQSVLHLAPQDLAFRLVSGLEDKRQVVLFLREQTRFRDLAEELCAIITAQNLDDTAALFGVDGQS